MKRLQATVSGRVQGVGFRNYVQKQANELDLTGYVCNLPGGEVEVVAEGMPGQLEELRQRLWKGPMFSKVTDVKDVQSDAIGEFSSFGVRY